MTSSFADNPFDIDDEAPRAVLTLPVRRLIQARVMHRTAAAWARHHPSAAGLLPLVALDWAADADRHAADCPDVHACSCGLEGVAIAEVTIHLMTSLCRGAPQIWESEKAARAYLLAVIGDGLRGLSDHASPAGGSPAVPAPLAALAAAWSAAT